MWLASAHSSFRDNRLPRDEDEDPPEFVKRPRLLPRQFTIRGKALLRSYLLTERPYLANPSSNSIVKTPTRFVMYKSVNRKTGRMESTRDTHGIAAREAGSDDNLNMSIFQIRHDMCVDHC